MNEDAHLEMQYEDRFFIEDTDDGDGFVYGWEQDDDSDED